MKYKKILNFVLLGFGISFIVLSLNISIQSQTDSNEKPRLKNFGSSLKGKKSKDKSEKTTKQANDEDEDVIKVETNLVRTDVLVIDEKGNAVLGLKKEDFIVTENDIEQQIDVFSLGNSVDIPRSIVLIIDYSGSQSRYLKTSIEAAKTLVDKLNPKDRMAIVTDDVKLLADFTGDKQLLKEKLGSLRNKSGFGRSLQYSALVATLNELFDEEDIRPMIIFQTDGDQAYKNLKTEPVENKTGTIYNTNFKVSDVIDRVEKSRATIYSVISGFSLLGLSPTDRFKKAAENLGGVPESKSERSVLIRVTNLFFNQQLIMLRVANASGGFTSKLEKPEQADEVYSKILEEINSRYLIGYYPEDIERNGKRRTVKIEVRGHPEYIVWGRKTYYAPEDD